MNQNMALIFGLIISLLCLRTADCRAQDMDALRNDILSLCNGFDGNVGVSIEVDDQTMNINGDEEYPLMSILKVPVAVVALDKAGKSNNQSAFNKPHRIVLKKLKTNTYSPLRDEMMRNGQRDTTLTLKEIIRCAVGTSDNNMCDYLIAYVGGIKQVDKFFKGRDLADLQLTETEATMHKDVLRSRNNWATPTCVTDILRKIFDTDECPTNEHRTLLRTIMEESPTGASKLKAGLPADVRFAHKTGLSDRLADGMLIASTDAGVVRLPNGRDCYISVLIKDTKEDNAVIDRLMADIARCVWTHVTNTVASIEHIRRAVNELTTTYPKARLQDIYKSFYQDRFGPGHLLADTARAKRYLESELEESKETDGPIYEPTGWNHQFYRVNLSAVKRGMVDKETYFDAFYRSTMSVPPFSADEWRSEWQTIVKVVSESPNRPTDFEVDSIRIDSMMQTQPTAAVHHSQAYNAAYHPHYRIIAKDIFEAELLPLLSESSTQLHTITSDSIQK